MDGKDFCRIWIWGLLLFFFGCSAAQRPVLYPNAKFHRVGGEVAEQDIADCMAKAREYISRGESGGKVAENAAIGAGTGAAVGAAGGAAGGAVLGHAGRAASVGAAGGAAAGATRGLLRGVLGSRRPDPVYRNFVNRCLREKGYEPIGWR